MLVTVQFPFADLRSFTGLPTTGRLDKPTWPEPQLGLEYIRNFGRVSARRRNGLGCLPGSARFGFASEALKFADSFGTADLSARHEGLQLECAFRRLFADGESSARLEIGFAPRSRCRQYFTKTPVDLPALIEDILSLRVRIPGENHPPAQGPVKTTEFEGPLREIPGVLRKKYLRATTSYKSEIQPDDGWIRAGDPLIVIEMGPGESLDFPHNARKIPPSGPLTEPVYFVELEVNGRFYPTWILALSWPQAQVVRKLRLCLLALHADRECLLQVLRAVDGTKFSCSNENLRRFCKGKAELLVAGRGYSVGGIELDGGEFLQRAYLLDGSDGLAHQANTFAMIRKVCPDLAGEIESVMSKREILKKAEEVGGLRLVLGNYIDQSVHSDGGAISNVKLIGRDEKTVTVAPNSSEAMPDEVHQSIDSGGGPITGAEQVGRNKIVQPDPPSGKIRWDLILAAIGVIIALVAWLWPKAPPDSSKGAADPVRLVAPDHRLKPEPPSPNGNSTG